MDLKIKSKFFNQEDVVEVEDKEINDIVENVIQADKDILSKIVYNSENHTITFPKGILPLRVSGDDGVKYFSYYNACIVESNGTLDTDEPISIVNECVTVDDTEEYIGEIFNMDYIMFCGSSDYLNAYNLYNPKELYWHTIHFKRSASNVGFAEGYVIILNNSSNLITLQDFMTLLSTEGFKAVVINGLTSGTAVGTYGTLPLYLIAYKDETTFTIYFYDDVNHIIATNDYGINNLVVEDLGVNQLI